jgi:predicted acetyltransferase
MELVVPAAEHLASYHDALERGFAPSNTDPEGSRAAEQAAIAADAETFLASLTDIEAKGAPFVRADGTEHARLPGFTRWIWDEGDFCGSINLRWQTGTSELPEGVPGHIGYVVPEWKRRRGYASKALALVLDEARGIGLDYVLLTVDPSNTPSRAMVERAGGQDVGRFDAADLHHPCAQAILYRIDL